MPRFVYRPEHPEADENGMVSADIAGPKNGGESSFHVIRDEMEPTRHMADGKYYTSKAKFREATRAAGCVEVGNETSTLLKPRQSAPLDRNKRVSDIKRVIEQLRNR